jgi:hypothetical protein
MFVHRSSRAILAIQPNMGINASNLSGGFNAVACGVYAVMGGLERGWLDALNTPDGQNNALGQSHVGGGSP